MHVVGGEHAEIYDGLPGCANVGFVLGGVYHPGDAPHVPDVGVDTLLVPVSGPWLKIGEALGFVRAVGRRGPSRCTTGCTTTSAMPGPTGGCS